MYKSAISKSSQCEKTSIAHVVNKFTQLSRITLSKLPFSVFQHFYIDPPIGAIQVIFKAQ